MQEQVKINLITPADQREMISNQPRHRPTPAGFGHKAKKLLASLVIIFIIGFAVFASSIAFSNENLIKNLSDLNFLGQMGSLIISGDKALQGESNDRLNFVLMGIGGNDHEGGTLADTIILGSFKPSTNQIAMMSLPRDLYVKIPNIGWGKINSVSAYAERKEAGSGGEAMRSFLADLLKTDIQYYAVIDFDGFEKLIDEFGGIDVYVENDLIDKSYPVRGREDSYPLESRYETLSIKKGWHHFDGSTALKYARSRHAYGIEGSDFARSKRQQKILLALKDKILKYNFVLNPTKISSLVKAYNDNIQTNLQIWEMARLLKLGKDADYEHPITYSLVDGKAPMLYDQMVNGSYALLPYGGSYDKVGFIFDNIFTVGTSTVAIDRTKWEEFKDAATSTSATSSEELAPIVKNSITSTPSNAPTNNDEPFANENEIAKELTYRDEKARIEIQNGTTIEGWAGKEATKLRAKGFNVVSTGNAATKGYTSIKIYDFSGGKYSLTTSELQLIYGARAIAPPAGLKSSANILIILGK